MGGVGTAQDLVEGQDLVDTDDLVATDDQISDPDEFGSDPPFSIGGLHLGMTLEEIARVHPSLSTQNAPFSDAIDRSVPLQADVESSVARFGYRNVTLNDDGAGADQSGLTAQSLYLPTGLEIAELTGTLRATGEGVVFSITLEMASMMLDCTAVAQAMVRDMGEPTGQRADTVFTWRSFTVTRRETLDMRCQSGQTLLLELSDPGIFERFLQGIETMRDEALQRRIPTPRY